jgi:hypothetical protein
MNWQPIETAPDKPGTQMFLAHATKRWVRMGRQYPGHGSRWYYSGTNERSQYAQVEGDAPTHWAPIILPEPPK